MQWLLFSVLIGVVIAAPMYYTRNQNDSYEPGTSLFYNNTSELKACMLHIFAFILVSNISHEQACLRDQIRETLFDSGTGCIDPAMGSVCVRLTQYPHKYIRKSFLEGKIVPIA